MNDEREYTRIENLAINAFDIIRSGSIRSVAQDSFMPCHTMPCCLTTCHVHSKIVRKPIDIWYQIFLCVYAVRSTYSYIRIKCFVFTVVNSGKDMPTFSMLSASNVIEWTLSVGVFFFLDVPTIQLILTYTIQAIEFANEFQFMCVCVDALFCTRLNVNKYTKNAVPI